ncbi:MAG: hypothetical protein WCU88_03685 [Elusimicrobiota bacterium]|jgi:hypothetical protein
MAFVLTLLLSWLPLAALAAPLTNAAAGYPYALAGAMIKDSALPDAPNGYSWARRSAEDLARGRSSQEQPEAFTSRILSFCGSLQLDAKTTRELLAHLQARTSVASSSNSQAPLLSKKRRTAILNNLQAHALALGLPADISGLSAGFPAAQKPPLLRLAAAQSPEKDSQQPAAASGNADAPVPWDEIAQVVKFGHRPWLGEKLDGLYRRLRGQDTEEARAQALCREAIDTMQAAPEGRLVLKNLLNEYRASGKTILVKTESFKNTYSIRRDGVETIVGGRIAESGQNFLGGAYCSFNSLFLSFQDKESARQALPGLIAHEFQHLETRAYLQSRAPWMLKNFNGMLLDEQRARVTGYLVDLRTHKDRLTENLKSAALLAQDPDAFWEKLKLLYPGKLDLSEISYPSSAYGIRIKAFAKFKAEKEDLLNNSIPRKILMAEILSSKEGLAPRLQDIRAELRSDQEALPRQIQSLGKTMDGMRNAIKNYKMGFSASGAQNAAAAPSIRDISDSVDRDQAAMKEALRKNPLPELQPGEQLNWKEFEQKVRESQQQHPEYWAEYRQKFGKTE